MCASTRFFQKMQTRMMLVTMLYIINFLWIFVEFVDAAPPAMNEYLIVSLPATSTISYVDLSEDVSTRTLRPLVNTGLVSPTSIAMDAPNMRLFIADSASEKIFWYRVMHTKNGRLITDGYQQVAVSLVKADNIAVNFSGDLFFSGKLILPAPDTMASPSIFRQSAISIATSQQLDPVQLFDRGFSNNTAWSPGPLAVDTTSLYWGNSIEGTERGTIVRGPVSPAHLGSAQFLASAQPSTGTSLVFGSGPDALSDQTYADSGSKAEKPAPIVVPESGSEHKIPEPIAGVSTNLLKFANNNDVVRGIATSARFIFYSTPAGIYAVDKSRDHPLCVLTTDCNRVDLDSVKPMGLVWDGDGTVYIADQQKSSNGLGNGGIYRIPSGDRSAHTMEFVAVAPGVSGITYLQYVVSDAAALRVSTTSFSMTAFLIGVLVAELICIGVF